MEMIAHHGYAYAYLSTYLGVVGEEEEEEEEQIKEEEG